MNLLGAGGNRSRVSCLGDEIVSHNTTDAQHNEGAKRPKMSKKEQRGIESIVSNVSSSEKM